MHVECAGVVGQMRVIIVQVIVSPELIVLVSAAAVLLKMSAGFVMVMEQHAVQLLLI